MKIMELIAAKGADRTANKIPTIVFLGDSVTQGCFEIYRKTETAIETVFDKSCAYHNYIAQILGVLCPEAPVNIINAGISGDSAVGGLRRLERDVLAYSPELTVVCFGLNDCYRGLGELDTYTNALREIFTRLKAAGGEVIFMTPNMMSTHVSCHITEEYFRSIAAESSEKQNSGVLEAYLEAAKAVAAECDVRICDVYAKWKAMYSCGIDVTELLANRVNHPSREMNRLFAYSLIEEMLK